MFLKMKKMLRDDRGVDNIAPEMFFFSIHPELCLFGLDAFT